MPVYAARRHRPFPCGHMPSACPVDIRVCTVHNPRYLCGLPGNATPQEGPAEALSLAETARQMREHLSALETRSKSIAETTSFAVDHAARGGAECIADVIAEWATSVRLGDLGVRTLTASEALAPNQCCGARSGSFVA